MRPEIIHADDKTEFPIAELCHILELSNSENDPDLSIARARVEPGVATIPHSLDGVTERYLITSGKGRVHLEGLEPQEVAAGDMVIIPPGTVQWIENRGETDLMFYCICSPRFLPEIYRDRSKE